MRKQSMIVIGLLAVLIIGVGIVIAVNDKDRGEDRSKSGDDTSSMANMPADENSAATPTPMSAPSDAVEANAVTIQNYAFAAKDIKVKVGATVTWTNQDDVSHTITADTASADAPSSQLISKGKTYSFTFKKAGTYSYHCNLHPYMKGTVTVTE